MDPCIKGGAGKRVESQYPQKLSLSYRRACFLGSLAVYPESSLCFVFRFHPYTAESILYNFLLWLNP